MPLKRERSPVTSGMCSQSNHDRPHGESWIKWPPTGRQKLTEKSIMPVPDKLVVLTFDDGVKSQAACAAVKNMASPGRLHSAIRVTITISIPSGFLRKRDLFSPAEALTQSVRRPMKALPSSSKPGAPSGKTAGMFLVRKESYGPNGWKTRCRLT